MKITLWVIGKTTERWLSDGISVYENRLVHYLPFELKLIPELKNAKNLSFSQIKAKEGELLLQKFAPDDLVVLLDDKGKSFSSTDFAKYIGQKLNTGVRNLVFVIGGAYGFSEEVYQRANEKISLSKMTFSHQMVRVIFVEQLYRAFTILRGEPYHHD